MDYQVILWGIVETVIYSLVGIIMMGLGFLLIKIFTPFSIQKEIEEDQNTSLGIIIGSIIVGISIIIAAVISSPSSYSKAVKSKTVPAADVRQEAVMKK